MSMLSDGAYGADYVDTSDFGAGWNTVDDYAYVSNAVDDDDSNIVSTHARSKKFTAEIRFASEHSHSTTRVILIFTRLRCVLRIRDMQSQKMEQPRP